MSKPDLSGVDPNLAKAIDDYIAEAIAVANGDTPPAVLPDDLPAPVLKAMAEKDEELAKERAEREALEAVVSKMRDEQLSERFAKRADDLAAVLGTDEGMADVLRELAEAAPEAYAKLDATLADTAAIVKASDHLLLKEIGSSNDESDPVAKINAIAKTIYTEEKGEFPTMSAARAEAWKRNPDLKNESRQVN